MKQRIGRVTVVGTGILGTQIAVQAAFFGYEVSVYDADPNSFMRTHGHLKSVLQKASETRSLTLDQWEDTAKKINRNTDLAHAVSEADLVIEAVPEQLALKRKVFEEIDTSAPSKAILASNSSSIPISRIESATRRPEKCVNLHFYFPVMGMNMVDVMGGTATAPEIIEACKTWIRSIGCVPLTVKKEILGFCFNRVWRAVKRETLYMWANDFVDFKDIDRAWMIFCGMRQGPFGLMDNVGLDVVYDIETVYYNESKDPRDHPPDSLKAMVDRKELGVKTGKGFYTYPNPEYEKPDFLKGGPD